MAVISFLHLSDLHYEEQRHKDIEIVIDALKRDLAIVKQQESVQPDFVIFSGDLVQAGNTLDRFTAAYNFLVESLAETLNLNTEMFFLAPGNHDIDRDRVDETLNLGVKKRCDTIYKVNDIIDSFSIYPYYLNRLTAFNQFTSSHISKGKIEGNEFFRSFMFDVTGVKVGICCLNSCWLATGKAGDADYGQLFIGERQISTAVDCLKDCDLRIAAVHHPFEWLSEAERKMLPTILLREFDLLLFGHDHNKRPGIIGHGPDVAITSHGGCLWQSRDYFNGYSIISCDLESNVANLFLRTYFDSRKAFEKATDVLAEGKQSYLLRTDRRTKSKQIDKEMQNEKGLMTLMDFKTELHHDGRLEIFARNENGALWHVWQDPACPGGWSNWECLAGEILTLDLRFNVNQLLEVFGLGKDKKIWHIWQDNRTFTGWSEWHCLEGEIDHFRVAQNSDGRLEIFAKWSDSSLRRKWQSLEGWSDWENLGGKIEVFEVSRNADGRLEVFSQWTDSSRMHNWQITGAGWSGWHSLG